MTPTEPSPAGATGTQSGLLDALVLSSSTLLALLMLSSLAAERGPSWIGIPFLLLNTLNCFYVAVLTLCNSKIIMGALRRRLRRLGLGLGALIGTLCVAWIERPALAVFEMGLTGHQDARATMVSHPMAYLALLVIVAALLLLDRKGES